MIPVPKSQDDTPERSLNFHRGYNSMLLKGNCSKIPSL
jgi:hypothetical protein